MKILKLVLLFLFLFEFNICAIEKYQPINPEFKLLTANIRLEIYTSGEENLFKYESPHGHWYIPQGWGHKEEIIIDLRRFKIDLGIINYFPFYFAANYQTWPYIPYADSLQLIDQEFGMIFPLYFKSLNFKFSVKPQSWSGHQITSIDYGLIYQSNFAFEDKQHDYYVWNFSLLYHQNSYKSMVKYLDGDTEWTASKGIFFDFTINSKPIGGAIYAGYRLEYRWNDDPTQPPLDRTFIKHSLFLGSITNVFRDLSLTYEGDWEWTTNYIRIVRAKLFLTLRTNLMKGE